MMKEFNGTKGPWDWDDEGLGNETMLVFGKNYPVEMTSKENKALIAAAPDLLEALQEMVAIVRKNTYPQPDKPSSTWGRMEVAELAIAKALGETK